MLIGDEIDDVRALHKNCNVLELDNLFGNLERKLNIYMNLFDGLETEYKQQNLLISVGHLIEPEDYVIGYKQDFVSDRQTALTKSI